MADSQPASGLDLSGLMQMLSQFRSGSGAAAPQAPSPAAASPGLDPSALMGMLQNLSAGQQNTPSAPSPGGVPPGLDLNLIVQIQKAMQALSASSRNVELLRTLKPHLSEARAKKVDDAIRVMQLIQLLPALKESGLFALGGDSQ